MLEAFETSTNVNPYSHGKTKIGYCVTFLQETYSTPEIINEWKFQWRGEMILSHGSNHSRGVLVLFNEQLQYETKNTVIDGEGRYILLEMTIQESPFLLLNLYAPTKLNEQFFFSRNFIRCSKC